MTHYDPRDWEPDDEPEGPHWLAAVAAALLVVILSFAVYRIAEARDFLILSEQGEVIAKCEFPVEVFVSQQALVCREPVVIFASGFEA